jgi:voltage-gated potassium channel
MIAETSRSSLADARRAAVRRVIIAAALLVSLVATAVSFYVVVEGWPLLDAFYMTVITLSTVGYREVGHLSPAGRVATMAFIVVGLVLLAGVARGLTELIVSEELLDVWGQRRRERILDKLRDHYIVCGYGRMGSEIVRRLLSDGLQVVVVEKDEQVASELLQQQIPFLVADATSDETLKRAGIERARGLVSVAPRDEDNLFITISARQLNPSLNIIVRCEEGATRDKFVRAGATKVVSPYLTGARQMAAAAVRPSVADFLEMVTAVEGRDVDLEEIVIREGSPFAGLTLREAEVQRRCGAAVVAVHGPDGRFHADLSLDKKLQVGDTLIVMGTPGQLDKLEIACAPGRQ